MPQAIERISLWIAEQGRDCKLVATPNVDHVVQVYRRSELADIFRASSMNLADGWPLVTMSRFYGPGLPERVPGSDLLPKLCQHAHDHRNPLRLFLLGGSPGVPERAAQAITESWPSVNVVGCASPALGFEQDIDYNDSLCEEISHSGADVLVVCLGFPKQELWTIAHKAKLQIPVALALGGTIDFLAGQQKRAPKWIQNLRLEWLHRLATNPRRLAKRYATDILFFPWICVRYSLSGNKL
ncbi:MAG: WecB/TagA/CpsF family glycosyltransferase [Aureliella sp.]